MEEQIKMYIPHQAKSVDGKSVEGGICDFEDEKGELYYLMIHRDGKGRPTITKIDINTVVYRFDKAPKYLVENKEKPDNTDNKPNFREESG